MKAPAPGLLVRRAKSQYIREALFFKGIVSMLRRHAALRRRVEGYTLSAIFHVLLLLVLATVTFTAGGEGFGFNLRSKGAKVQLTIKEETIYQTELEDLIEDVQVKPLQVERVRISRDNLPELSSFSTPRPSPDRLARINTRFSPNSGNVASLSGQFGTFIGGLRKSGLDIALVIDATASMQYVIDDIKARSIGIVAHIQSLVPIARIGVVAFRDRGEDFSVRWTDLSFHASKIEAFISNLRAKGGGDYEEGVRQGLEAAIDELGWRKRSKRVIIVVGSSPPHARDMEALAALAEEFSDERGVISAIDVTQQMHERYEIRLHTWLYGQPPDEISPLPDFYKQVKASYQMIADHGKGDVASLGSDEELAEKILYFAFGSRWQKEVARYTADN